MSKVGERIKELRLKSGLTQEKFAEEINKSKQTISNYENNERTPDIDSLIDIAIFFNVSVDYLTGKSEFKNSHDEFLKSKAIQSDIKSSEKLVDAIINYCINSSDIEKDMLSKILPLNEFRELLKALNTHINNKKYGKLFFVKDIRDGIDEHDLKAWRQLAELESEIKGFSELDEIILAAEKKAKRPILKYYIEGLFNDLMDKLFELD